MLKIDTSELEQYAKYLRNQADKLKKSKQEFFAYLMTSPKVRLEAGLLEKIDALVYMDGKKNKWYERTGRLGSSQAVKTDIIDDKLVLYMNDEWLQSNTADRLSRETGFDPDAHSNDPDKSYSERVEYGYTYDNNGNEHPYTTRPRPFMEDYFDDLIDDFKSGKISAYEIIKPLFEGWDR